MAWGWGLLVTAPNYPPSQTRVRGTGLGRTGANSYRKKGRGPPGVGEGAPSSGSGSETWTCPPQRGGCCPRTDELTLSPAPGALGCVRDRPGREDSPVVPCSPPRLLLCPFPGSSVTCLIPCTGLNASPLHLHSVSRVTSNVTSFLPSSIHWSISFNQPMEKPVWALYFKAPLKELRV